MGTDIKVSKSSLYNFNDKVSSSCPPPPCPPSSPTDAKGDTPPTSEVVGVLGGFRGAGSGRILLERGKVQVLRQLL